MKISSIEDDRIVYEDTNGRKRTIYGKSFKTKFESFIEIARSRAVDDFIHLLEFTEMKKWMNKELKMESEGIVNFRGNWICTKCLESTSNKMSEEEKQELEMMLKNVEFQKKRHDQLPAKRIQDERK